ncbi:hypothetical protein RvY_17274 [Ramazzottius varieornatus]|uniref:Uncharacterized protein n=1 Tax=Ramazzottius varieornatus TaxID=947166 RepID=A0A1D1W1Z2_RAMVA|nr:hypothetical protein RvY_17274 [Ramazzottius varieornatus]
MDIPVVSGSSMREVLRTTPSSVALFPTDKVWSRNATLVATGSKNYNLDNLQEFFTDIGHPEGWDIYQDTKGLTYDLTAPNVKVYCISGTGVPTPAM